MRVMNVDLALRSGDMQKRTPKRQLAIMGVGSPGWGDQDRNPSLNSLRYAAAR